MRFDHLKRYLVVAEDSAQRFRVFDAQLRDVETVAMMPDDSSARLVSLPSGGEWLAIGAFGQWDHYGEPALGPPGASRVIDAPTNARPKKPAAKKRGAKR